MYIDNVIAKGQLVPLIFSQDAAADAQSAVAMNIIEAAGVALTTTEYVMPWDFDIVGISVVSDLARTAGTLTVDATKNGTVTGLQAVLDATNTFRHYKRQARESDRGQAGDRIGVKLTTASWTPITADIVVIVWALVNLEGI
jgi:hypothetical protein